MTSKSGATIYVVLLEDCHADVEPYVFLDSAKAIILAKELMEERARFPDDIEEQELTEAMVRDRWIFYATYSVEGDSVTVMEREIND